MAEYLQALGRVGIHRLDAGATGGYRRGKVKQFFRAVKGAGGHNGLELLAAQGFLEYGGHAVASLPLYHLPFHTDFHDNLLASPEALPGQTKKPKQNGEVNLPTAPIPVIRPPCGSLCYGRGQGLPPLRGTIPEVSFGRNEQT